MQFLNWMKSRSQAIAVYLLMILVLASSATIFYLNSALSEKESLQQTSKLLEVKASALATTSSATDIAAREYVIEQNAQALAEYQKSFGETKKNYDSLRVELERQNFESADIQNFISNVGSAVDAHQKYLSL